MGANLTSYKLYTHLLVSNIRYANLLGHPQSPKLSIFVTRNQSKMISIPKVYCLMLKEYVHCCQWFCFSQYVVANTSVRSP